MMRGFGESLSCVSPQLRPVGGRGHSWIGVLIIFCVVVVVVVVLLLLLLFLDPKFVSSGI